MTVGFIVIIERFCMEKSTYCMEVKEMEVFRSVTDLMLDTKGLFVCSVGFRVVNIVYLFLIHPTKSTQKMPRITGNLLCCACWA